MAAEDASTADPPLQPSATDVSALNRYLPLALDMCEGADARPMNVAIILAGGRGTRVGADVPKRFIEVLGRLVPLHTIERFRNHPEVDGECDGNPGPFRIRRSAPNPFDTALGSYSPGRFSA